MAIAKSGCKVGVIAPELRSLRKPLAALRSSRGIIHENDHGVVTFRGFRPNLTPRIWSLNARRIQRVTRLLYEAYTAQEGQPDLIHVHSALLSGVGALDIKRRLKVPFVLSEHSSRYARGLVNASGKALSREIALEASERYAVSAPLARLLDETLTMPAQRFSVMPNIVDGAFLQGEIPNKISKEFNFLHISMLDEIKNVPALLQAFASRFHGQLDVSLTIAGDGPTRPALETLAKELDISGQVLFAGKLTRSGVLSALSECQAFVLPSRYETFGVVLVEALAMGVPVIATRCGGPEDIVTNANSVLISVDDIDGLARAMDSLQQNPSLYDPVSLREDCRARFGPQAVATKWREIYARVAADGVAAH